MPTKTIQKAKNEIQAVLKRYGLTWEEIATDQFPTESFEDYDNPKAVKASLNRALKNLKAGRIKTSL